VYGFLIPPRPLCRPAPLTSLPTRALVRLNPRERAPRRDGLIQRDLRRALLLDWLTTSTTSKRLGDPAVVEAALVRLG
jgi:hypothetical protein